MTFVWKDKALRAAGRRGVAKARAYGLATNRRAPITLARVRWLERPELPITEREKTGRAPAAEMAQKSQSSVHSPRERRFNILRPAEPSRALERRGRQSPNARRGATWRGLYGRQRGARLDTKGRVFYVPPQAKRIDLIGFAVELELVAGDLKSRMSLGDWLSVIIICAAIAATGIALAWVVGRSEMCVTISDSHFPPTSNKCICLIAYWWFPAQPSQTPLFVAADIAAVEIAR
jgi:hypothetical protein